MNCVCFALVWPHRRALGAKEWRLGFAYTERARYGPVLTSNDDYGVVVTYWNMRLMPVTRDTSQVPMSSLKSVALEPAGGTKTSTMSVASLTSQSLRTHKALQHHSGP